MPVIDESSIITSASHPYDISYIFKIAEGSDSKLFKYFHRPTYREKQPPRSVSGGCVTFKFRLWRTAVKIFVPYNISSNRWLLFSIWAGDYIQDWIQKGVDRQVPLLAS